MASRSPTAISTASSSTGQIIDLVSPDKPFIVKILLLGNRFVGKASLVIKLNEDCQHRGEQYVVERVAVELPNSITLSNFAPGNIHRDGRTVLRKNFPDAHGVVLMYDISNRQSYDALRQWYKKIKNQIDKYIFKIVIGNKADVDQEFRQVATTEGRQFASKIGWAFLEASAKQSVNIRDIISLISKAARHETTVSESAVNAPGEALPPRESIFNRITRRMRKSTQSSPHSVITGDLLSVDNGHISSPDDLSSFLSADECSVHSEFDDTTFEQVDAETGSISEAAKAEEDESCTSLETVTEQIRVRLSCLLKDEEQKQILLCQKGPSAQSLLDLFHMLLDHPGTDSTLRSSLMVATKHLCYRSSLYPRNFMLKDIRWEKQTLYAGGFGDIWKGWFQDQEVCLKVVKVYANCDNDRLIRAFSKEAILWSHISHPNTLPFYGIIRHPYFENRICLVSPWMTNGNVNEYLRAHPEVNRNHLISDTAEGTRYLHENNIIHGDLKGVNILINSSGRACIGDFGLSTIVNDIGLSGQWTSGNKETLYAGGTLRWQAPELLHSDFPHVTKMSDVYAFACVCYEILTGNVPFHDIFRDPPVMLRVITGVRPSRPEDSSISDCLWKLMESCWGQEPSGRPGMQEVVDSLRVCSSVEKQDDENWGTLSSSSIRLAMHGPMKHMSTEELEGIFSWL